MGNVLSDDKKQRVVGLGRLNWSLRRIEEATGVITAARRRSRDGQRSCPLGHSAPYLRELSSRRRTLPIALEELSRVKERPTILSMPTTARPQQRYDHRLWDLVQGTGDVTIATDLGVPRSTARGWLGKPPKVVVSLNVTDQRASELQQEVLEVRRRAKKVTALLRLAVALLRSSGFTLTHKRLPDGLAKTQASARRGSGS